MPLAKVMQARFGDRTERLRLELMAAIGLMIIHEVNSFAVLDDREGSGCWILSIEEKDFLTLKKQSRAILKREISFILNTACGTIYV